MEIKYLYTPTVARRGQPVLMNWEQVHEQQGFRSVFGYPDNTQATIKQQGNTRDLRHHEVHSRDILVDFDDNEEAAKQFQCRLVELQIAFQLYDSGNRSQHFHIDCVPVTAAWVPQAMSAWVREQAPGADMTVYHPAALFRLPGTWHEKNPGGKKRMIVNYLGGKPVELKEPAVKLAPTRDLTLSEEKLLRILNKSKGTGGRRCYVWYLAKSCRDYGFSLDKAMELVLRWNQVNAHPPLETDVVRTKVEEVYEP